MFFYKAITKIGEAVIGCIDGNYPKKETVKPRVYHKYLKQEDKNRLYPELSEEKEEQTPSTPTEEESEKDMDTNVEDSTNSDAEEDPQAI